MCIKSEFFLVPREATLAGANPLVPPYFYTNRLTLCRLSCRSFSGKAIELEDMGEGMGVQHISLGMARIYM